MVDETTELVLLNEALALVTELGTAERLSRAYADKYHDLCLRSRFLLERAGGYDLPPPPPEIMTARLIKNE